MALTRLAFARGVGSFWGITMLDDNKRVHDVKSWLTDREYLDLCKQADREDRKPGELLRVILRRFMYGNVGADPCECNGTNSADTGCRK